MLPTQKFSSYADTNNGVWGLMLEAVMVVVLTPFVVLLAVVSLALIFPIEEQHLPYIVVSALIVWPLVANLYALALGRSLGLAIGMTVVELLIAPVCFLAFLELTWYF